MVGTQAGQPQAVPAGQPQGQRPNPWSIPLSQHQQALERAQAAGDQQAVQEISRIVRVHPERAPDAYRKAQAAGDVGAAQEIRQLYGTQRPIKTREDLENDPLWIQDARALFETERPGSTAELDDATVGKKAIDRIRWSRNNSVALGVEVVKTMDKDRPQEASNAMAALMEQYEKRMPVTMGGVSTAVAQGILDPLTLLGGVGGRVAGGAGRAALKVAEREAAERVAREGIERGAVKVADYGFDHITDPVEREIAQRIGREGVEAAAAPAVREATGTIASRKALEEALKKDGVGDTIDGEVISDVARRLQERGVRPITGRDVLKGTGAAAAVGGGLTAGFDAGRQALEIAGGTRDEFDIGNTILAGGAGATFGAGLGSVGGLVAAGGSAKKLQQARGALRSYRDIGDVPLSAQLQTKAIHQLPVGQDVKARAKELFDAGDVAGLSGLWKEITADKAMKKLTGTREFNASVVKSVNQDHMTRGDAFLSALRSASKKGALPEADFNRLKASWQTAKAPNSAWSPEAILGIARNTSLDPIVREAAEGLGQAAYRANETVGLRTIRAQLSGLEEFVQNPIHKGLADAFVPGGSTGIGMGSRVLTDLGRRVGLVGQKPLEIMGARAKAAEYAKRVGLDDVFKKADAKAGQNLRKIENSLGKLERNMQKQNAKNTPPAYQRGADAQDGVMNGLATFGTYLGFKVDELKKVLGAFAKAHPDRQDISWYSKELIQRGGIKNKTAFLGMQDDLAAWLIKTGQRTPEQLAKARMAADQLRFDKEATTAILAEQAVIKKKLEMGLPLTRAQARTKTILEAKSLRESLDAQVLKLPGLKPDERSMLLEGIEKIAAAKSRKEKTRLLTKLFDRTNNPQAASFIIERVVALTNFGPQGK